jgi:hypothetical protein
MTKATQAAAIPDEAAEEAAEAESGFMDTTLLNMPSE